jgi:hypothetical protein
MEHYQKNIICVIEHPKQNPHKTYQPLHPYYLTFGNLCLMCGPTLNFNSKIGEHSAPLISFGSLANIQYGMQNLIVNIEQMFFLIH